MWSYFKKKEKDIGAKLLINYIELAERDLKTLIELLQVSKEVAVKVNVILQSFYAIPYMKRDESLSGVQLDLLEANSGYFSDHGWWFISCSKQQRADAIKKSKDRVSCSLLKCPQGCKEKISIIQAIELLIIPTVGAEVKRNIFTSFYNMYYPLIKNYSIWLIMEIEPIEKYYSCLAEDDELLLQIFFYVKHLASLMEGFKHRLALLVKFAPRNLIMKLLDLESKIEILKYILDNPELFKRMKLRVNELEHSLLVKGRVEETLILKIQTDIEDKIFWIRTDCSRHIFVERNALTYSCVSNCFNALFRLTDMPYEYPQFIIFSLTHGEYILKPDDSLTPPKDIWKAYSSILSLALYTTITYILGVETDTILWRKDIFVPILYSSILSSNNLKVSEIIYSLGGRTSELYVKYVTKCTELFLSFRKHFMVILLLLQPLRIPRTFLEAKLNPIKTDAQSIRIFVDCITKNAKETLGVWKYVGY